MKVFYYVKLLFTSIAFFDKATSTLTSCPRPQNFTYGCDDNTQEQCHYFYGPSYNNSIIAIGSEPKRFTGALFMHDQNNQSRPLNYTVDQTLEGKVFACKYDVGENPKDKNKFALFQGRNNASIQSSNWRLTKKMTNKERFECQSENVDDCLFFLRSHSPH